MSEAYQQFLAEKLVKTETSINYAIKRLHELVLEYDLPFLSDDIRNLLTEINRLKNYLNENHPYAVPTA